MVYNQYPDSMKSNSGSQHTNDDALREEQRFACFDLLIYLQVLASYNMIGHKQL